MSYYTTETLHYDIKEQSMQETIVKYKILQRFKFEFYLVLETRILSKFVLFGFLQYHCSLSGKATGMENLISPNQNWVWVQVLLGNYHWVWFLIYTFPYHRDNGLQLKWN